METHPLTEDITINRLLNGMWQVSGAHGRIHSGDALADMLAYHDAGLHTWDLADHYGPAEDLIGLFKDVLRRTRGPEAVAALQALTKWVPRPGRMSRSIVEDAIQISLRRMRAGTLDMLQFHWWEYRHTAYLDALKHLSDLQTEGKIRLLGLTNFDTEHLAKIREAGVPIVSNQVQFSIIDQRPLQKMAPYCTANGVSILAYGTLGGGFFTDRYLNQPEPDLRMLDTASLRKYKNMIDAWGSWEQFQAVLRELRRIADRHETTIAAVAIRYVLQQPAVAGVIAGVRLGLREHRADNLAAFGFTLRDEDCAAIQTATAEGNDLLALIGDCGDEYRRR